MATLLLQAAGAAIGATFGAVGKAIGLAAGSLAGYYIDRALINSTRTIEGARLSGLQPLTGEEGAPIARLYGAMRLGGTVIWATRFEEERQTTRQGFKGGPRVISYRYHANLAIGLCEGEIAGVRRVWADGRELDLTTVDMRVHRGDEAQLPDPLIEAKQGAGNAPAYRGVAYVVFERLALEPFGNRVPQLNFEVMRPAGRLNQQVKAVALIPGATEYGLHPALVTATPQEGETVALNRHMLTGASDFVASLDELQALCPQVENIALVVSWFGDDLRAGHCAVRPGVTTAELPGASLTWSVCGMGRAAARLVSTVDGKAAYGGTPADATVMAAIREIKARGLKVTLYPFVMMDIPAGNALPDPYGAVGQAAFPWRGRITASLAPGRPGTPDKTAAARSEIAAFCGNAAPAHFAAGPDSVNYSGPANDFGYRRFVLHCAALAQAAGGVDAFLLGSELRGLTTLRDQANAFPFVEALQALAANVRAMLGGAPRITYGADWSEYFGYQPADGSGDAYFHLDPLWAHPAIDAVGVDNYFPLSDWRDEDWRNGNPDGAKGPCDRKAMTEAMAAGEGYDWYYASDAGRQARQRLSIADGAYAKPWVFRPKDLVSWWSNLHFDRPGGVESTTPTTWIPRAKPIWFTELGCPAIDKGANQPNVFPDPKSSEDGRPHFSGGGRDDAVQSAFLQAHMARWDAADPVHDPSWNPVSPVYGGPMVDASRIYLWAWDARPFPAFPAYRDVWGDHQNHQKGHWLNGRLCGVTAGALIDAILADHGLPPAGMDAGRGFLSGYAVERPGSAREAIEPLLDLFGLAAREASGAIVVGDLRAAPIVELTKDRLVAPPDEPAIMQSRAPDHDLPHETLFAFRDPLIEHQAATVRVIESEGRGRKTETLGLPAALDPAQAEAFARDRLRRQWVGRAGASIVLPAAERAPAVGDAVRFGDGALTGDWLVVESEEGLQRRLTLAALDRATPSTALGAASASTAPPPNAAGRPLVEFLDLPLADVETAAENRLLIAAWARPWRPQNVLASPGLAGFEARARLDAPAIVGVLETALPALPAGANGLVRSEQVVVRLVSGALVGVTRDLLLNGANFAAIKAANGVWELLQFEAAEEVAADRWRISGLLRGQGGTDDAMASGAPAGARFVLLDSAIRPAGLKAGERGLALNWRVGPNGADAAESFNAVTAIGGIRAGLHFTPAHLRARRLGDGSIGFEWIRCGRHRADGWDGEDIPLDAAAEIYRIVLTNAAGQAIATAETGEPRWLWPAAGVSAAFGAGAAVFAAEVRQVSPEFGPGLAAIRDFSL